MFTKNSFRVVVKSRSEKKSQNYSSQKFMSLSLETHFRIVEYIFHNFDFEQNIAKTTRTESCTLYQNEVTS